MINKPPPFPEMILTIIKICFCNSKHFMQTVEKAILKALKKEHKFYSIKILILKALKKEHKFYSIKIFKFWKVKVFLKVGLCFYSMIIHQAV